MKSAMFVATIATVSARALSGRKRHKHLIHNNFFSALSLLSLAAACDTLPPTPAQPAPLSFVGSQACRECHAPQFELWQGSHHALAMQEAGPDTVLGDFSGVEFDYFDVRSTFLTRDGIYLVQTDNADGELQEFTVKYTFGVTPLQQYLVEMPDGHVQALPISWDTRSSEEGGQRWYHLYPDEFIAHDDVLHWTGREQNWNYMCAECHSTDLRKNYDANSQSFATTWAEINVGCEACHGPASRHIARARSGSGGGLTVDLDDSGRSVWQMNTVTGIAERSELLMRPPQQPDACGRCHARRSVTTGDYEFGRPLQDTHAPALLDTFLYYPDGQILEEVYVYGSFLQSRMYQAGVSCSDCHDPHSARLRTNGAASEICSTCHLPDIFSSVAHHKHEAGDVACVDCHMASRTYMGVDDRRDHSFRIPRPDLTISTGSPNACNQCHDDRDSHWAVTAINTWHGVDRKPHYGEAIHAGRSVSPAANDLLIRAISNSDYPGIARATALTLLRPPYSAETVAEIRRSLGNPDSLLRRAALSTLSGIAPEIVVGLGAYLLTDPVRSVRIEAARVISPWQESLPVEHLPAFRRATEERIAAQLAIAERPEAHMNLGNVYLEAGDAREAEAAFQTALRLEPRAAAVRVNLADLYARTGRTQDAQQLLRDGLAMHADEAVLHHALGLMLVRDNQQSAALAELAMASSLQPDESRYVYVYAVAMNSQERPADAIALLQDAARRFPTDFDIHWALATMLRDQGRIEEAREVATNLAEIYPQVDSIQNLLQSL